MRRFTVLVTGLAVAMVVFAAPAAAHTMTCQGEKAGADHQAKRFVDFLNRGLQDTARDPQRTGYNVIVGALGRCTPGASRKEVVRVRGRKKSVRQVHAVTFAFKVQSLRRVSDSDYGACTPAPGTDCLISEINYTLRVRFEGREGSRRVWTVLRPDGSTANFGEERSPDIPSPL